MKRTSFHIPDLIYRHCEDSFTQIPNEFLRNPALSAKAKGLFCLLLSNKDGWYSHMKTIQSMMSDGKDAIRTGLKELEEAGYLKKFKYRDKDTKRIKGTLWVYSTIPNEFPIDDKWAFMLDNKNLELINAQFATRIGKPSVWKPSDGKSAPKNTNRKILKDLLLPESNDSVRKDPSSSDEGTSHNKQITPSQFDKFWELYPRGKRVDKGKAKTAWEKLCRKKDRPNWKTIADAIIAQRKSERWQNSQYIPHPTTWLNQQRWLDDPAEMKSYGNSTVDEKKERGSFHGIGAVDADRVAKQELGHLAKTFVHQCVDFSIDVFDEEPGILVTPLIALYKDIDQSQRKAWNRNSILKEVLPGPIELIRDYLTWIDEQTWITDKSLSLLSVNHKIFKRFCLEKAKVDTINRHPLTGKPCR